MNMVMRIVTGCAAIFLVACTPSEPETYTTSANVDDVSIPTLLAAVDGLTDNDLPVEDLLAMAQSVPMDEEKQQRVAVVFGGEETDMLIHIWREQADWVHVYASSTSQELVNAVENGIKPFERVGN
ncbi:MAG: hypothetical protein QNJ14_01370 [Woeseiaceae bacterium]|nr:hypothetical protein [Woeseiaceae bacterium]